MVKPNTLHKTAGGVASEHIAREADTTAPGPEALEVEYNYRTSAALLARSTISARYGRGLKTRRARTGQPRGFANFVGR